MECDKNHIHILFEVDPQFGVHRAVKSLMVDIAKINKIARFGIIKEMPDGSYLCNRTLDLSGNEDLTELPTMRTALNVIGANIF